MYAWRARIGLIKPTHRGKSFHFWYDHAPDGKEWKSMELVYTRKK